MHFQINRRVARVLATWIIVSHTGALMPVAISAPEGGVVAAGGAQIGSAGGVTQVTQLTDRVIVNWQGFSTASGETVRFLQPSSTAVALNRVTGGNASALNGALEANGRVFLLNPNGIIFGRGATVNTAGLVASTLSMQDGDFLAGRYALSQQPGRPLGAVINRGTINVAPGGAVALVAPAVSNEGTITAPGGRIALAAGTDAVLNLDGQGLVNLAVKVGPRGTVAVPGGQAADALASVVNNQHLIEAGAVSEAGGVVTLGAAEGVAVNAGTLSADAAAGQAAGGTVRVHGTQAALLVEDGAITARGTGAGQVGGSVQVLGDRVGLLDRARVDASGGAGGGLVNLGGARTGGPGLPRAKGLYIAEGAQVAADGTARGAGGEIIAFSEGVSRVHGRLTARGGTSSGDGGFIETSGGTIEVTSMPDVRARSNSNSSGPAGGGNVNGNSNSSRPGTWLIDPGNITIVDGFSKCASVTGAPNFTQTCEGKSGFLGAGLIVCALKGGNVLVKATKGTVAQGDISVVAAINYNSSGTTLTLEADRNITFNQNAAFAPIGLASNAGLIMRANLAGTGGVTTIDNSINTAGQAFSSTGGDVMVGSTILARDVDINHTGNATVGATVLASRNLTLTGNEINVSVNGVLNAANRLVVAARGNLSSTGVLVGGPDADISAGGNATVIGASSNNILVVSAGGALVVDGLCSGNEISLKALTGNLCVGTVNAVGAVTLQAGVGNILDANAAGPNITGRSVSFITGSGVVGSVEAPLGVSSTGRVAASVRGTVNGVAIVLSGTALGNSVTPLAGTAGRIIFNGATSTATPKRTLLSLAAFDSDLAFATYGEAALLAVQAIQNKDRVLARSLLRIQPGDIVSPAGGPSPAQLTPQEVSELNAIFGAPAALPPPPLAAPVPVAPPAPPPAALQGVALSTTPQPTPVFLGGTAAFAGPGTSFGGLGSLGNGLLGGTNLLGGFGGSFGGLNTAALSAVSGGTAPAKVAGSTSFGGPASTGSFSFSFAGLGDLSALGGTAASRSFLSFASPISGGVSNLFSGPVAASFSGGTAAVTPVFSGGSLSGGTLAGGTLSGSPLGGVADQLSLGGTPIARSQ